MEKALVSNHESVLTPTERSQGTFKSFITDVPQIAPISVEWNTQTISALNLLTVSQHLLDELDIGGRDPAPPA